MESLRRSAFLTRGRRWKIFGLWLVVIVASELASIALGRASAPATGQRSAVVLYVWDSATTAFSAVMTAVSYYFLRLDKEGAGIDEIAAVFD